MCRRSSGYEYCSSCISESFSHDIWFVTGSGMLQGMRGGWGCSAGGGRAGARLRASCIGVRRGALIAATWVARWGRVEGWRGGVAWRGGVGWV